MLAPVRLVWVVSSLTLDYVERLDCRNMSRSLCCYVEVISVSGWCVKSFVVFIEGELSELVTNSSLKCWERATQHMERGFPYFHREFDRHAK